MLTFQKQLDATPFLRSFMNNYMVTYQNTLADGPMNTVYVKAFDADEAYDTVTEAIKSHDMLVKNVVRPGDEDYGLGPANKNPIRIDMGFGF
jgi:hypothetical protein